MLVKRGGRSLDQSKFLATNFANSNILTNEEIIRVKNQREGPIQGNKTSKTSNGSLEGAVAINRYINFRYSVV